MIERPDHFIRRYPSLVWAFFHNVINPSGGESQPGAGMAQNRRSPQEAKLGLSISKRLIAEFQIAQIVEKLDDPQKDRWTLLRTKTAGLRLARFGKAKSLGMRSLTSVYERFPFHFIDIDALVHIVWIVGTIQPIALLKLLDSSDDETFFLQNPNLSIAKFFLLEEDHDLGVAFRRVVRHLVSSSSGGIIPKELDPTFDEEPRMARTIEGFETEVYR